MGRAGILGIMSNKTWIASDLTQAEPASRNRLSVLEFQDNSGEWHDFEVLKTQDRRVFGGSCNAGFMESGCILREEHETLDETLSELL